MAFKGIFNRINKGAGGLDDVSFKFKNSQMLNFRNQVNAVNFDTSVTYRDNLLRKIDDGVTNGLYSPGKRGTVNGIMTKNPNIEAFIFDNRSKSINVIEV